MKYAVLISLFFFADAANAIRLQAGDRLTISNGMSMAGSSERRLVCSIISANGSRLINMSPQVSDEEMDALERDRTMVQSALLDGQNVEIGSFRASDFKLAAERIKAGLPKTAQLYIEAVDQRVKLGRLDLNGCMDELRKTKGTNSSSGASQGTKQ